jgi:preprotein translocase subunit SecD
MVVLAGPWSTRPVDAQPPPEKWCLSFHEVHPLLTAHDAAQRGVPPGYRIVPAADSRLGDQLLRATPIVHAGEMADARAGFDPAMREPIINFRLTNDGARKFGLFTRNNIGARLLS